MIQVDGVNGLHHPIGYPTGNQHGQHHAQNDACKQPKGNAADGAQHGFLRTGHTKNAAVIQLPGKIDAVFTHGVGCTGGPAGAGGKGIGNFLPLQVIDHALAIMAAIVEYIARCINQRYPLGIHAAFQQLGRAVGGVQLGGQGV